MNPRPNGRISQEMMRHVRRSYRELPWRKPMSSPPRTILVPAAGNEGGEEEPTHARNPLGSLGACGCRAAGRRTGFMRLGLMYAEDRLPKWKPLVYTSLGSGDLLCDWMFLEEMHSRGFRFEEVHLVDPCYKTSQEKSSSQEALAAVAAWMEATSGEDSRGGDFPGVVEVRAYRDFGNFVARGCRCDLLMQCDADVDNLDVSRGMRPGAIHLYLRQGGAFEEYRAKSPTADEHQVYGQGMILLERRPRNGMDRKRALEEKRLWRVKAERVPNGLIGVCERPEVGSRFINLLARGVEVVLSDERAEGGWAKLHEEDLGIERPTPARGSLRQKLGPGWVLLNGEPRFGDLLERVDEQPRKWISAA